MGQVALRHAWPVPPVDPALTQMIAACSAALHHKPLAAAADDDARILTSFSDVPVVDLRADHRR